MKHGLLFRFQTLLQWEQRGKHFQPSTLCEWSCVSTLTGWGSYWNTRGRYITWGRKMNTKRSQDTVSPCRGVPENRKGNGDFCVQGYTTISLPFLSGSEDFVFFLRVSILDGPFLKKKKKSLDLTQLKSQKRCQCVSAPGHTINLHLSLVI